jgi:hypothetical protein
MWKTNQKLIGRVHVFPNGNLPFATSMLVSSRTKIATRRFRLNCYTPGNYEGQHHQTNILEMRTFFSGVPGVHGSSN